MDERINSGCWVKIDDDRWHDYDPYFVHEVEYKENSTATKLILEDSNSKIFTIVVASHQIYKVSA